MPATKLKRVTPDKLPDPWLLDTEHLLVDLARIRDLALRIPQSLEAVGPVNSVIEAVWDLEDRLRYLLKLSHDGQVAFRRLYERSPKEILSGSMAEVRRKAQAG